MLRQASLPLSAFAFATLLPLGLFGLGAVWGGVWALGGLLYMTLFSFGLDQIKVLFMGNPEPDREFPGSDALLLILAHCHLLLLPLMVFVIATPAELTTMARVALFAGAGLWLGQVGIPVAHELIHRGSPMLQRLGIVIYGSILFGHHASAHRHVHHRHAASAADPNSARSGEGFYRFFLRAWAGSFRAGLLVENDMRARQNARMRPRVHPYALYTALACAALLAGFVIAGWLGVVVWAGLSLHAQVQLLLSDYVQHYGLTRRTLENGKLEPVADRHSWNAPYWFTSALMLNAPRHSDHHAHPSRAYPDLRLPEVAHAPRLPWPLPLACTIALVPPLWKRLIRPHLAPWRHL